MDLRRFVVFRAFLVGCAFAPFAGGCTTTSKVLDVLAQPIAPPETAAPVGSLLPQSTIGGPVQASAGLLLFGGRNHDLFLGCLNCSKLDQSSIWNAFGDFGSKFQANSIWNEFGPYGSRYSATSPWNEYGNSPPVVVDSQGNFYGCFTANKFNPKRTRIESLLFILANSEYIRSHFDELVKNMH